jgi:hypothetical protein
VEHSSQALEMELNNIQHCHWPSNGSINDKEIDTGPALDIV